MNAPREKAPFDAPGRDAGAAAAPRVLLCDIEPATAQLFAEWLAVDGLRADSDTHVSEPPAALVLIDLPFPRRGGAERLRALAQAWPGVPVIMLSATLLPGVSPRGELARQFGVAAVLPAPVSRADLLGAVRGLLEQAP